jgi:selenocysteine-specific elongation factor
MMLDADLQVLRTSPMPIKDLTRVHLHLGTAQVVARVRVLGGAGAIPAGERGWVQFRLEAPVVAAPGDRFIVRRYSPLDTVGGGRILDAAPPKHSVSGLDVVDELRAMNAGSVESASLFVRQAEARGLGGVALSQRLGVDEETLGAVVESVVHKGDAFRISEDPLLLVSSRVAEEISARLARVLESFQKANPLRDGMSKGELREKAAGKAPVEIFEWILERAVGAGKIQVTRDRVATSDHKIQLTPEEANIRGFLAETYLEARYQPQTLAEMAARGKKDQKLVGRIERLLLQQGTLVKIAEGMVFHREVLEELKQAIRREKAKGDHIDIAFFKQLAGVTRKHAIPLLEWLDRERVTRRVGKDRVVL